jgi:PhnB protein
MSFAAYLLLPGTARAAMEDYARIFGAGDLRIMTVGDASGISPGATGLPGDPDHVIHAQLSAGPGAPLMATDDPGGAGGLDGGSSHGTVLHAAPDAETARRVFEALAEEGRVRRPLGPVFWSPAFGIVTDRWGVTWRITVAPAAP